MSEVATVSGRPSSVGIGGRVVNASLWSLGGQAVTMLASLAATPIVIRSLGPESYGILALINVLIGYIAFSDFGLGLASTKLGADAYAHGNRRGESAVVWTSLVMTLSSTAAIALLLGVAAPLLLDRCFHVPAALHASTLLALRLGLVGFVLRAVSGVFNTSEMVRLRIDLYTVANTVSAVVQILLVAAVVWIGYGLVGAVGAIVFASFVGLGMHIAFSFGLEPAVARVQFDRSLVRPLFRFGSGMVAANVIGIVLANLDKVILAGYASVTALAYYTVATTLATMLAVVPRGMVSSLLPAFTRMSHDPDRSKLRTLYVRAQRGMLFWVVPAAVLMMLCGRTFLSRWAGPEYGRESTIPLYILTVGVVFQLFGHIPKEMVKALDRTDLLAKYYAYEIVPHIVCTIVLTLRYGAAGGAAAWTLRTIADVILFYVTVRRLSGLAFSPLSGNAIGYLVAAVLCAAPLVSIRHPPPLASRLVIVTIAVGGYCLLVWYRVLGNDERLWIRGWVGRVVRGVRAPKDSRT